MFHLQESICLVINKSNYFRGKLLSSDKQVISWKFVSWNIRH